MAWGDSLFKEIGNTLSDTAKTALQAGVASVRTAIARDALVSQQGQAVIAEYKMQTIQGYIPWIIAGIVGLFLLGRVRV